MKKLLVGLGALAVIVAVGAFFLLGSLNDIVKAAIEKIGSDLTQTKVTLDDVDIEETSGRGVLRGFRVTNPDGFSDGDAFTFDEVSVTINAATLLRDPVVIKEIVVFGPEIVYEFGERGNNLATLNKNVRSKAGARGAGGSAGRKFVIERLILRDGRVAVQAPLLDDRISVPMPTIRLSDIGKDGRGATPGDIADQTMAAVLSGARDAVSRANIDVGALTRSAGAAAKDARDAIGKAGGEAVETAGDAIEGAGAAVKDILKGIGK